MRSWLLGRGRITDSVLITTDGFKFYPTAIKQMFGPRCIFGQAIKKWSSGRVRAVERKVVTGMSDDSDRAPARSEDSDTLNTSFIERLNLTIRQGSA